MLYLSFDFCLAALERTEEFSRFNTGRKEPYGYFDKGLSCDVQKVKDLTISNIWNLGSERP
jgi:hypothetical protein